MLARVNSTGVFTRFVLVNSPADPILAGQFPFYNLLLPFLPVSFETFYHTMARAGSAKEDEGGPRLLEQESFPGAGLQ
jgi:hypothetical protein